MVGAYYPIEVWGCVGWKQVGHYLYFFPPFNPAPGKSIIVFDDLLRVRHVAWLVHTFSLKAGCVFGHRRDL